MTDDQDLSENISGTCVKIGSLLGSAIDGFCPVHKCLYSDMKVYKILSVLLGRRGVLFQQNCSYAVWDVNDKFGGWFLD